MTNVDLQIKAHQLLTVAKGWDEKHEIICQVYKNEGYEGLIEFSKLVGISVEELYEGYALRTYLKKRNRSRRQRKLLPKPEIAESKEQIFKSASDTDIYHRENRRIKKNELATHIRDFN